MPGPATTTWLVPLMIAAVVVAGCGGPGSPPPGAGGTGTATGAPPVTLSLAPPVGSSTAALAPSPSPAGTSAAGTPGAGVSCAGRAIAPVLDPAVILGRWLYLSGIVYEDGRDYDARVTGTLVLTPDRRWDGTRQVVTGTPYDPVAYGPGAWTFDGRTLTLAYDDGSDAETYTGVRVGSHQFEDREGRSLVLEIANTTSCTVYTLVEAP